MTNDFSGPLVEVVIGHRPQYLHLTDSVLPLPYMLLVKWFRLAVLVRGHMFWFRVTFLVFLEF